MTCVVGLLDKGDVWMGADGVTSTDYIARKKRRKKICKRDGFVLAIAGSVRVSNLMQYAFEIPKHDADDSLEKYMYVDFIDALRTCLKTGGCAKKEDSVETIPTSALITHQGRLFKLACDFQLNESLDNFDAAGSGEEVALGSLATSIGRPPRERVMLALKAAARFIPAVGPPFSVMCLRGSAAKGR